jgi:hypothetical protein
MLQILLEYAILSDDVVHPALKILCVVFWVTTVVNGKKKGLAVDTTIFN